MACLAVLMQGSRTQKEYPSRYLDGALAAYRGFCKSPAFATRAVLLSTEAMKSKMWWRKAASQFMGAVDEESDLKSALMFEQAAYCYLRMKTPQARKFAFHLCLAGQRFVKAGQKKHGLRCYRTAMQVYADRAWHMAENHITFLMGKLSIGLGDLDEGMSFIGGLFSLPDMPAHQQASYVKEYLTLAQRLHGVSPEALPQLTLPLVVQNSVEVELISNHDCPLDALAGENWEELERACAMSVSGSVSHAFTPSMQYYSSLTKNTLGPHSVVGEVLAVTVSVSNTVSVPLVLSNTHLLWEHQDVGGTTRIDNECTNKDLSELVVRLPTQECITLPPNKSFKIRFSLIPQQVGTLKVKAMAYDLSDGIGEGHLLIRGKQELLVKGPRLNSTYAEKNSVVYGVDNRLNIKLVPAMPRLQVDFFYSPTHPFPSAIQCGETRSVRIKMTNKGKVGLKCLRLATNSPELCYPDFASSEGGDAGNSGDEGRNWRTGPPPTSIPAQALTPAANGISVFDIALRGLDLGPDDVHCFDLWLRGPAAPSEAYAFDLLFYYETCAEGVQSYRHRCSKHRFHMSVQDSVQVQTVVSPQMSGHPADLSNAVISLSVRNGFLAPTGDITEYEITDLVCASSQWRVCAPGSEAGHIKLPSATKVNPNEVALFCLKVAPCPHPTHPPTLQLSYTSMADLPGYVDTPSMSLFQNALKALASTSPDDTVPHVFLRHFMAVLWKAVVITAAGEATSIHGQSHVELIFPPLKQEQDNIIVLPSRKSTAEGASKLVDYALQYPAAVQHPFASARLCHVPVTLTVTNNTSQSLHVVTSGNNSSVFGQGRFFWTGPCKVKFTLAPGMTEKKSFRATFMQSGTYKLDSLSVKVGPTADKLFLQSNNVQTLITVENVAL